MTQTNVLQADLNLLKLFHALAEERSVTRAGIRLGLSQPAASRGLARLRQMLDDRLFVRTPLGLELTPRAEMLVEPVRCMLSTMQDILAPPGFDPASVSGSVSIAAIDRIAEMIAPALTARLSCEAPFLCLDLPQQDGDNVALVSRGTVDTALGVFDRLPAGLFQRVLFEEDYVCVVRRGHPATSMPLTPASFAALSHVAVRISGHGSSSVDIALARSGLQRRIGARVPQFATAIAIVAESDLIVSLPQGLAQRMTAMLPVTCLAMPLSLPRIATTMIWHERRQDDPLHRWLREQIVEVSAAVQLSMA